MKPQSTRVIFAIFLVVAFYAITGNKSQGLGCNFPRLDWFYPTYYSWAPNSSVHVFIDSRFNQTDRFQLALGLINWTLWSDADCSGVTFYGFDTIDMSGFGMSDMPPPNTVWIISQPTQFGGLRTDHSGGVVCFHSSAL